MPPVSRTVSDCGDWAQGLYMDTQSTQHSPMNQVLQRQDYSGYNGDYHGLDRFENNDVLV